MFLNNAEVFTNNKDLSYIQKNRNENKNERKKFGLNKILRFEKKSLEQKQSKQEILKVLALQNNN